MIFSNSARGTSDGEIIVKNFKWLHEMCKWSKTQISKVMFFNR